MCISKFYTWYNGNGNHLLAYLNLITYSFISNSYKSLKIPNHGLFDFTINNLENTENICNCDKVDDLTRKINPFEVHRKDRHSLIYLRELCRKYVSLKNVELINDKNQLIYDICVHIRDGDIYSTNIHREYVQPPLDYYIKVLEMNINKKICFVYCKGNSPYIPILKEYVNKHKMINVFFQSNSLKEDISTLCNCRMLVWSYGSFCLIPTCFSNTIEKLIIPNSVFNRKRGEAGRPWFDIRDDLNSSLLNIKLIDFDDYISIGMWKNSEENINKMKMYLLKKEEYVKLIL